MEALESSSTGPFNPMEIKYGTIICFLKCRTNDQNRRCSKISRAEKSRGCGNNSFCYRMAADTVQPNKGLCAGEGAVGHRGAMALQPRGQGCPCHPAPAAAASHGPHWASHKQKPGQNVCRAFTLPWSATDNRNCASKTCEPMPGSWSPAQTAHIQVLINSWCRVLL